MAACEIIIAFRVAGGGKSALWSLSSSSAETLPIAYPNPRSLLKPKLQALRAKPARPSATATP